MDNAPISEADAEQVDAMPTTSTPVTLSQASIRAGDLAQRGLTPYLDPSSRIPSDSLDSQPEPKQLAPAPDAAPSAPQAPASVPAPQQPAPQAQQPVPSIPGIDPDPVDVAQQNYTAARQRAAQSMQDVSSRLSALGFPTPPTDALADPGALHDHVQSSINAALASPQANQPAPFGPNKLTPQSDQLRQSLTDLGNRAASAVSDHAAVLSNLRDSYSALQQAQQAASQPPPIPGLDDSSSISANAVQGEPATGPSLPHETKADGSPTTPTAFQPTDAPYRKEADGTLTFDPQRLSDGVLAAHGAGEIDDAKFKELYPKAQAAEQAMVKQKELVETNPVAARIMAGAVGLGRFGAFELGAPAGAAIGGEIGALGGPFAEATIPAGAFIGGLVGGTAASWGYDKVLKQLAKYSETVKDFTDASEAHPYYDAAGNILGFASGIPKAAMKAVGKFVGGDALASGAQTASQQIAEGAQAAQATGAEFNPSVAARAVFSPSNLQNAVGKAYQNAGGGLASTIGNLTEEANRRALAGASNADIAKVIAARVGGNALGMAAIDTAIKSGSQALGMGDGQTVDGALQSALIGAFISGHGLSFPDAPPKEMASVVNRAYARQKAGVPLDAPLTPEQISQVAPGLDSMAAVDLRTPLSARDMIHFGAFEDKVRELVNNGKIPVPQTDQDFSNILKGATFKGIEHNGRFLGGGVDIKLPEAADSSAGTQPQSAGQPAPTPDQSATPKTPSTAPAASSVVPVAPDVVPPSSGKSGSFWNVGPVGGIGQPSNSQPATPQQPPSPYVQGVPDVQKAVMSGALSHADATSQLQQMGLNGDDIMRAIGPAPTEATAPNAASAPANRESAPQAGSPLPPEGIQGNRESSPASGQGGTPPVPQQDRVAELQQQIADATALQDQAKREGNALAVALHGKEAADARNELAVLQSQYEAAPQTPAQTPSAERELAASQNPQSGVPGAPGATPEPGGAVPATPGLAPHPLDIPGFPPLSNAETQHEPVTKKTPASPASEPNAETTSHLGEAASSAPSLAGRYSDLLDLNSDQLSAKRQEAADHGKNLEQELFGEEGAKRYRSLLRRENSYDNKVADAASAERQDMEDALTEQQRKRLFGDDSFVDPEEIRDIENAVNFVENAQSPSELGDALKFAATSFDPDVPERDLTLRQAKALAEIRAAARLIQEKGWNPNEVASEMVKRAASRFSDPNDAALMLDKLTRYFGVRHESLPAPSPAVEASGASGGTAPAPVARKPLAIDGFPDVELGPKQLSRIRALKALSARRALRPAEQRELDVLDPQAAPAPTAAHPAPTSPSGAGSLQKPVSNSQQPDESAAPAHHEAIPEKIATGSEEPAHPVAENPEGSAAGSEGLAAPRGVGTGGESGGKPTHPRRAENSLLKLVRERREADPNFALADPKPGQYPGAGAGVWVDEKTGEMRYAAEKLANSMDRVAHNGGDPKSWLKSTVFEEPYHVAQIAQAGPQFRRKYELLWSGDGKAFKGVPENIRRLVAEIRPEDLDNKGNPIPWRMGAEFERMVAQYRATGTITEVEQGGQRAVAARKLFKYLAAPQSKAMEQSIAMLADTKPDSKTPPIPGLETPVAESAQEAKPVAESETPKDIHANQPNLTHEDSERNLTTDAITGSPTQLTGKTVSAEAAGNIAARNERILREVGRLVADAQSGGKGGGMGGKPAIEEYGRVVPRLTPEIRQKILNLPYDHPTGWNTWERSEGAVVGTGDFAYKIYQPREDGGGKGLGLVGDLSREKGRLRLENVRGGVPDIIEKATVLSHLGVPTEVVGVLPETGEVVTKQPNAPEATAQRRIINELDTMGAVPVPVSAATQFGTWMVNVNGRHYLVTDLRDDNVRNNSQGEARPVDVVIHRVTDEEFAQHPELAEVRGDVKPLSPNGLFANEPYGKKPAPNEPVEKKLSRISDTLEKLRTDSGLASLVDDIQKVLSPDSRLTPAERERFLKTGDVNAVGNARKVGMLLDGITAEMARRKQQWEDSLKEMHGLVSKLPSDLQQELLLRMDEGTPLKPGPYKDAMENLQKIDREHVEDLKNQFDKLGLDHWKNFEHYEQYIIPHQFEDQKAADLALEELMKRRKMQGGTGFLKNRTGIPLRELIASAKEQGIDLKLKHTNPVDAIADRWTQQDRYISAHKLMQQMEAMGTGHWEDTDYQPKAGEKQVNNIIGQRVADVPIDRNAPGRKLVPIKDGDGHEIEGTNTQRRKQYFYADEPSARVINDYLSSGLRASHKWIDNYFVMANALNGAQLGLSAFHGGFVTMEGMVSSFALGLQKALAGDMSGLKTMALAPFSTWHDWKLGGKIRQEMLHPGNFGQQFTDVVNAMVSGGFRDGLDSFYKDNNIAKFMQALRDKNYAPALLRAPMALIEAVAKPIMEHFVPRMKAAAVYKLAEMHMKQDPNITPMELRRRLQEDVRSGNNRFGQMTYDNLHLHKTVKDLLMGMTRSLGWNWGTFSEIGGGLNDWARFAKGAAAAAAGKGAMPRVTNKMAYTLALPLLVGAMGAVMSAMFGQKPKELKDYYFVKTGDLDERGQPIRVSLPSYMKDVFHAANDPLSTVTNKLHPILSTLGDMLRNKDFYGVEIRHAGDPVMKQLLQELAFAGKQFVPFTGRNAQKLHDAKAPPVLQLGGLVGLTQAPASANKTAAQQLADNITADSRPNKVRTSAEADKTALRGRLIGMLRAGNGEAELNTAIQQGKITPRDVTSIRHAASMTPLQYAVMHMSANDAQRVYDKGTPEEKQQLAAIVQRKQAPQPTAQRKFFVPTANLSAAK